MTVTVNYRHPCFFLHESLLSRAKKVLPRILYGQMVLDMEYERILYELCEWGSNPRECYKSRDFDFRQVNFGFLLD